MSSIHSLSQHHPNDHKPTLYSPEGRPPPQSEQSAAQLALRFTWDKVQMSMVLLSLAVGTLAGLAHILVITLTHAYNNPLAFGVDLYAVVAIFALVCALVSSVSLTTPVFSMVLNGLGWIAGMVIFLALDPSPYLFPEKILPYTAQLVGISALVLFAVYFGASQLLRPVISRREAKRNDSSHTKLPAVAIIFDVLLLLLTALAIYSIVMDFIYPKGLYTIVFLYYIQPEFTLVLTWIALAMLPQTRGFCVLYLASVVAMIIAHLSRAWANLHWQSLDAFVPLLIPLAVGCLAGFLTALWRKRRNAQ